MSLDSENIQRQLEEALKALDDSKGEGLARQLRPILFSNLDRGRIQGSWDENPDRIRDYVWRVAETFATLNPYLHQLQTERRTEVWEPLFERMQTWAYNFFLRKNFAADQQTREIAIECATEAAIALLNAHFPYDTEFDAWAHTIVQNACRKFIHKAFKKSAVPEDKKVELDDDLVVPNELLLDVQALHNEAGGELTEALEQLSEARRTVVQLIYFDEMEPLEVAQKMGKSVGAIYGLQFHALNDLRKILSTIRDNLNEG
jgi:RNA polymerase sigma factor (sigma-70 family)